MYQTPQLRVEERFVPLDGGRGLSRLLKVIPLDSQSVQVWLRLATGRSMRPRDAEGYQVDGRWNVHLHDVSGPERGQIRKVAEQWEWIVPLRVNAAMTLRASYQW